VFENRVLGKILGSKRDDVTGDWRKLRSVTESYSGENIKNSGMGWECGMCGGEVRCRQRFGAEAWGKEPLGRLKRRLEDNIKINLQEMGWESVVRIDLARHRG
jgi:hypothetical protein